MTGETAALPEGELVTYSTSQSGKPEPVSRHQQTPEAEWDEVCLMLQETPIG